MEEESGKSYGAAGFDNQLCFQRKLANRRANFVFRDSDDVIDVLRNVLKVDLAD